MAKKTQQPIAAVDFAPYQSELQRIFEAARDLVDARLKGVIVKGKPVVRPTGRIVVTFDAPAGLRSKRAQVYGHYAQERYSVDGETVDHIAFNPYMLGEGGEQVSETMVHEYVHKVAQFSGIQDTSRGGTWHNKSFQALAEATKVLGTEANTKIGVTTHLTDEGRTWLREEVRPDFGSLYKILEAPGAKKAPTTVRFACDCGMKATVSVKQRNEGFVPVCDYNHDAEHMALIG